MKHVPATHLAPDSLDSQCRDVFESTIIVWRELGSQAATKHFNTLTATWPIFAVSELGDEINKRIAALHDLRDLGES